MNKRDTSLMLTSLEDVWSNNNNIKVSFDGYRIDGTPEYTINFQPKCPISYIELEVKIAKH